MSKFKIVLIYIKKYIFWVISLVCLLATMIVGNIVAGSKESYFQTRESAIEGRFSEMQRLAGQDTPNEIVVTQKKEDVRNLKENILDAWMKLYAPQRDLLADRWPEFRSEKDPEAFDQNALVFQEQLRDAWERQTLYDQQNLLSTDVANAYRDYVMRSQARDFMKRYGIKVPKLTLEGGAGNMGAMNVAVSDTLKAAGDAESELPTEGKMSWDETNRQQMLRRFSILARNTGASRTNSTRKIFMVQEDIWAYDIILDAIAKMNTNCEGDHDAVVKRIKAIDIADDASTLNTTSPDGGRSSRRESTIGGAENDSVAFVNAANRVVEVAEQKMTGDEELDMSSMSAGATEDEEAEASPDPEFDVLFDNRYCDKYGNFMSAARFRAFLNGMPEYKMLPIHVRVVINQDQIPRLMLNCMNAAMPIYIHQISVKVQDLDSIPHTLAIVPEEKTSSEDGGLAGAPSPKRSRYGNENGGAMATRGTEVMNMNALNGEKTEQKPEDVEFEFWGMICMFSKPDASKFDEILSGESGDGESGDDSGDDSDDDSEDSDSDGEDSDGDESGDESGDDESGDESGNESGGDVTNDDAESEVADDAENSGDDGVNDSDASESDAEESDAADSTETAVDASADETADEAVEESSEKASEKSDAKAEKKSSKSSRKKSSKG